MFLVVLIVLVVIAASGVRIIPQSRAYVVERLGAYHRTMQTGLHYVIPFIERVANNVSLKEIVKDFPPQPVITKDNVTMQIDTVVYFQITDSKLYTYGIENPVNAIENLTRVEVKNILPPRDIQESMEKQMRAERERREAILKAEGEKKSAILIAEGEKESTILRADAEKEAKIRAAEGEAEAIIKIQEATAQGLRLLKSAEMDEAVLKLKSYEAMVEVANGNATKIIVPSELQNLVTLGTTLSESAKKDNTETL